MSFIIMGVILKILKILKVIPLQHLSILKIRIPWVRLQPSRAQDITLSPRYVPRRLE